MENSDKIWGREPLSQEEVDSLLGGGEEPNLEGVVEEDRAYRPYDREENPVMKYDTKILAITNAYNNGKISGAELFQRIQLAGFEYWFDMTKKR